MSIFPIRLKEARLRKGLSQEQLGIDADLDPASASTRVNRYELGKRKPDSNIVERLARVLGVPTPYFYTENDELADLILRYHKLPRTGKQKVINLAKSLSS